MRTIHDDDPGSNTAQSGGSRSRDALARRTDELEAVLAAGGVGYCRLDPQRRPSCVSSQMKALFGWPPDAQLEWAHLCARLHSQDRDALEACLQAAFETGADFDLVVHAGPEGAARIALQGRPTYDADGTCRELLLIARDVGAGAGRPAESARQPGTAAAATASAPDDRDDRLALAVQAAGLGCFEWNVRTGRLFSSAGHARLLGMTAQPRTGSIEDWLSRTHPADRESLERSLRGAVGVGEIAVEYRVVRPDGTESWLFSRGRLYPDTDGSLSRLVGVTEDITGYKQRELEHAAALERERELREAADAANRAKDEFISLISHELRSPLNAILGWNRILTVKCGDHPEVAAIAPRIEQGARAQLKLVNDLLDFGRIGTGKLRIEPRPMRLARVVASALEAAQPAASDKRLTVHVELEPASEIYGDPERLEQVVANLLSNAIKFTEPGGRIDVSLKRTEHTLELAVADTGAGIAPELLPYVFERFRQGTDVGRRRAGGLGLGLMLVREIVTLHGGKVIARSEGLGHGSTFIVSLPAAPGRDIAADRHASDTTPSPGAPRMLQGTSVVAADDESVDFDAFVPPVGRAASESSRRPTA